MTDRELNTLEHAIGRLLRIGVGVSGCALAAGLILWFADATAANTMLRIGLLLLIAVPVTRILASFGDALRRRDRLLSWATGVVLLIMLTTVLYLLSISA